MIFVNKILFFIKKNYQTAFLNPGIIPKDINSRAFILDIFKCLKLFDLFVKIHRFTNLLEIRFFFFLNF